jgi:hypothetical protein
VLCSGPLPVAPAGRPSCRSTSRPGSGRRKPNGIWVLCCSMKNSMRLRSRSIESSELRYSHWCFSEH